MVTELCSGFEYNEDSGIKPLSYTLKVPCEGAYRVEAEFESSGETFLFANGRRLFFHEFLGEDKVQCHASGIVSICPTIPRGYSEVMENNEIVMTLEGKDAKFVSVKAQEWSGTTIHIAGDSSVTNQTAPYPYYPAGSYCGWGQMLPYFLKEKFAVVNHAHSGLTTESFRTAEHYKLMYDRVKPGDYCLFQFGHNDQKLLRLKAQTGYRENLRVYAQEIRQLGAFPVIITPIARNSWRGDTGEYNDLLADNAEACIELGREFNIPIVRLHELSMEFVKSQGMDRTKDYYFPADFTHTNDYGGYLYASYVCSELARNGICEKPDRPEWMPDTDVLDKLPKDHCQPRNSLPDDYFEKCERPEDIITRVEAFTLVAAAVRFSATNVYNDMFTDVVGHETYAGIVQCAYQNGFIPAGFVVDEKIYPLRQMTKGEFAEVLMSGLASRKTLKKRAKTLIETGKLLKIIPEGFDEGALMTRAEAAVMCDRVYKTEILNAGQ